MDKDTQLNEFIIDAFNRVKSVVHATVSELTDDELTFRPSDEANSIGWLVWHLARVQDDHIAEAADSTQIWKGRWYEQFHLPYDNQATGYGQTAEEVSVFQASDSLLLGYYDAVHDFTTSYVSSLTSRDYEQIIDKHWDPPVTLAVRLASIIADDLQHAGQAAYVRGLIKR
jgi:uncharacterized damage-inducible protein DinB